MFISVTRMKSFNKKHKPLAISIIRFSVALQCTCKIQSILRYSHLMSSNKSNRKIDISNSSLSEMNTTEENTDKNASKSLDSEEDFAPHFIDGNEFEFEVDISQKRIFEVDRVLSGKKNYAIK